VSADPILGTLAYPCDMCGANSGDPCLDTCPGNADGETWPEFSASPVAEDSEARLMAAVHRLSFGGLIGIRGTGAPDRQDYEHDEWMARLADWMTDYQRVLAEQVQQLQDQARAGIALQFEKDVVKAFFGKVTQ
jgi:hypothetical protein